MSERMHLPHPPQMETLEDRVLFSASPLSDGFEVTPAAGPEIHVQRSGLEITDGQAALVFFPATPQGETASTALFVITNTGTETLNIGRVVVPSGYILERRPAVSIAPGDSSELRVRLNTENAGVFNGQISMITNDADENPFNFPVRGRVVASGTPQDIDVFAGAPKVQPGDTVPINFGQAEVGGDLSYTFRLRNDGGQTLNITNVQLPAGFSLTSPLPSSLAAGDQTMFTVEVDTSSAGIKSGNMVITTNDPDPAEKNFTFAIQATVGGDDSGITPDAFEGATGDNTAALSRFHFNNDRYRFHNIHNTGDVDWIRFYVPQTSYVAVRAVHTYDDPGATGDLRMQLYGPKATNNSDGIDLTAPAWNATAIPQPDRPNDTILVRAGFRALTQGWYWLKVDSMTTPVTNYGIRVYVRPLATDVAEQIENASAPAAAAFASTSSQTSTTDDSDGDQGDDLLLESEPILSFLA